MRTLAGSAAQRDQEPGVCGGNPENADAAHFTVKNRPEQVREAFKRHSGQLCISTVTPKAGVVGSNPAECAI
jgi:hypothetical protein